MERKHPAFFRTYLLAYIISLLLSSYPYLSAHAQYQPELTLESGSAFREGRGLYISGGYNATGIVNQTFMIDLSVSWNTGRPAYKSLPLGPLSNWFASALTADGREWFVYVNGAGNVFDFQSNKWDHVFDNGSSKVEGYGAATDPETGKIYIPFAWMGSSMMVVDLKNGFTTDNINTTLPTQIMYAVTWNSLLKGLIYAIPAGMYQYIPSIGWANLIGPQELLATEGYCLVSSDSGSKVVLFGGSIKGQDPVVSDIFILDFKTHTWKKGTPTSPEDIRRSPACAISNDYFIAWGGQVRTSKQRTLVYDLKVDKWVSCYIAPGTTPTTTNPSVCDAPIDEPIDKPSTPSGSMSYTGAILGAICGGLAVGLIAGGVYGYRARKNKLSTSSDNPVYMDTHASSGRDPEEEMRDADRRLETVHVGAFGFKNAPQDPHALISTNHSDDIYTGNTKVG
ncbi:MAG: hypothetical protein J3Q66DRAFT_359961 [Benniella sp.]|nr:MAG: hypothetical protein J3Q66DRAFT_359961 [Benniella sp.]